MLQVQTGEMPGEDKAAVQEAMNALVQQLHSSYRFRAKVSAERMKGNSFTAALPAPIKWVDVEYLCKKYDADALLAIEKFDSDFILTKGKSDPKKVVDSKTKEVTYIPQFYAEGVANIRMGLRVYDPVTKEIIDQQSLDKTNTWSKTARSQAQAVAALIDKSQANVYLAALFASDYAYRISPMPIRLNRTYYRKSKKAPEIEQGANLAEVNSWESAISVWERGLASAPAKEAGYLTYNIAVANEVLGNLEQAIKMSQDAYAKFGEKKARSYTSRLFTRQAQIEALREE